MAKDVKICVIEEESKKGENNSKILIDLNESVSKEMLDKLTSALEDLFKDDEFMISREKIKANDVIKTLLASSKDEKLEKEHIEEDLANHIMKLAHAFREDDNAALEVANSIYVAYLMMKDEISLEKIMKYANFSMPELEMIKYYLLEKNNF